MKALSIGRSQEGSVDSPPSSDGSFSQRVHAMGKISPSKHSPEFASASDSSSSRGRSTVPVGLPATPRAMRHPKYSDGYADESISAIPEFPGKPGHLPNTTYQAEAVGIPRSMSVPIGDPKLPVPVDLPTHPRFNPDIPSSRSTSKSRAPIGHHRNGSRDLIPHRHLGLSSPMIVNVGDSATSALQSSQISTVEAPPILPELQHLSTPPPPPPVPMPSIGQVLPNTETINIAIENVRFEKEHPRPVTTGSAVNEGRESRRLSFDHRRGKSINEAFATKIRNLTGRMRSTSRDPGGRSPPVDSSDKIPPYESIQLGDSRKANLV
jgi:hypothetical protein